MNIQKSNLNSISRETRQKKKEGVLRPVWYDESQEPYSIRKTSERL